MICRTKVVVAFQLKLCIDSILICTKGRDTFSRAVRADKQIFSESSRLGSGRRMEGVFCTVKIFPLRKPIAA